MHAHAAVKIEVPQPIWYGDLMIDTSRQKTFCKNEILHLSAKEYTILLYLASSVSKKEYVSKTELFDHLYRDVSVQPESNILNVFVCKIRKKLKKVQSVCSIETLNRKGYALCVDLGVL